MARENLCPVIRRHLITSAFLLLLLPPILFGSAITFLASLGYFPILGQTDISLQIWSEVFRNPSLLASIFSTLISGIVSTLLALICALFMSAHLIGKKLPSWIMPFIASPHSAFAIGFAFLIAPSGWIARLMSANSEPFTWLTVGDHFGLSLAIGLFLKEMPFMLLVTLAAMRSLPLTSTLSSARTMRYPLHVAWLKLIIPQAYPLIKLPLLIVFVYALTNVDMALVLGPSHPPTLSVLALRSFHDPNPAMILTACAYAILLCVILGAFVVAWWLMLRIFSKVFKDWAANGSRVSITALFLKHMSRALFLVQFLALFSFVGLFIWSWTWRWSFPNIIPESLSLRVWSKVFSSDWGIVGDTLTIAIAASLISIILAIIWIENHLAKSNFAPKSEAFFFLPLVVPPLTFLFGFDQILLRLGFQNPRFSTIYAHVLFILPYTLIVLERLWRAQHRTYGPYLATLGHSPLFVLWRIKLPLLLPQILLAFAVGVSVSVAQYLPTLFSGRGRIETITTEAISLSSGSDRRLTSAFAFMQLMIPLLAIYMSEWLTAALYRNRKGMRGTT